MSDQLTREEMQATVKAASAETNATLTAIEKSNETNFARMLAELQKSVAELHKLYADAIKWIVITIGVAVAVMGFFLQTWLAAHLMDTRPPQPIVISVPAQAAAPPPVQPPSEPSRR
jgi:sigma54-dependent transcription regulator